MLVNLIDLNHELINWYKNSNVKGINLVTVPYRGIEPIAGLLDELRSGDRILYVTGEAAGQSLICRYLAEKGGAGSPSGNATPSLRTVTFDEAIAVGDDYTLIIYDDINSFPSHNKNEMHTLLTHLYKKTGKIIAYSMERVFKNVINLEYPVKSDGSFIPEPRFIESRIDIKDSIPSSLYSYIKFFLKGNRKVVIVTPEEATKQGMITYIKRVNPMNGRFLHEGDGLTGEELKNICLDGAEPAIIFLSNPDDLMDIPINLEYIITNANSTRYNYRQFVYLALRSCLYAPPGGEVLLIGAETSDNIEMAREITREYNRARWESDDIFV